MFQVLLVDDEPSVRLGMKKLIDWEQYGFVLTDTACNGLEACNMQKDGDYDLIITDLKMPGMDGLTMIRTMRQDGYDGEFMILSAYGEFEYARSAMQYGVRYYLLKPVDEQMLIQYLQTLKELLQGRDSAGNAEDAADVVSQVKQYTNANYQEKLSLKMVASELNFNASYLGRTFKRSEGVSYSEYLNQVRIRKAKQLLQSGGKKIFEIADMVGYQDESYFNRCFKRIEGITPTEYQAKLDQNI